MKIRSHSRPTKEMVDDERFVLTDHMDFITECTVHELLRKVKVLEFKNGININIEMSIEGGEFVPFKDDREFKEKMPSLYFFCYFKDGKKIRATIDRCFIPRSPDEVNAKLDENISPFVNIFDVDEKKWVKINPTEIVNLVVETYMETDTCK